MYNAVSLKPAGKTLLMAAAIAAMSLGTAARATTNIPAGMTDNFSIGSTLYQGIKVPSMNGDYPATGKIDSRVLIVKKGWQVATASSTYKDMTRYYLVYVPLKYKPGTNAPLVIVLHGGGLDFTNVLKPMCRTSDCAQGHGSSGYGASVWATSSPNPVPAGKTWNDYVAPGFDTSTMAQSIADEYGVLVAVPNGTNASDTDPTTAGNHTAYGGLALNYWNDCSMNEQGPTDSSGNLVAKIDDVGFITQMIQKMKRPTTQKDAAGNPGDGYSIDPNRIYVTGASNGGDMAHRLARELPGVFAAAGFSLASDGATPYSFGHPLQLKDQCANLTDQTASPVPIWMFKGQADHAVPYYGGVSNMNFSSWYIPYEPYPAGFPGLSNKLANFNTNPADLSFIEQTLTRYKLYNTVTKAPVPAVSTYLLQTNPRPTDTVPWTGHTSADDGTVAVNKDSPTNSLTYCDVYINTSLSASTAANPRAQVTNCSASNSGHIEASWAAPADNSTLAWTSSPQSLDFDTTTEYWKFFQHWTLTTYKP